jgi:N-acyl-D-amino-acid deacylase
LSQRARSIGLLSAVWLALPLPAQTPERTLIRSAVIVDGSGGPRVTADVRIVGDRIVEVGQLRAAASEQVVDAHGLVLAPGFIDTHSHHDRGLTADLNAPAMTSQGVTTIVVGQDGSGMNRAAFFARLDSQPAAVNVASYAGHGSIRRAVLGADFKRPATAAEVERMKQLLRAEMQAGALGLSTGLEYDPGIYSTPDEVLQLSSVAGEAGGRYISHIRSEDRELWKALDEVINIGRTLHMPVQVSHLKLGMSDLWGRADSVVELLNRARAQGVDITADVYPYTYWQSNLGVFYPRRNFSDSAETAFVLAHLTPARYIVFNSFPGHADFRGKTLAQIAQDRGTAEGKTMMDLLAMPDGSDAGILARGMDDADVETLMRWPYANVCSDGQSTGLHPRGFGSFAKVVGLYSRDKKLFPLEEAVRKMTSLAATNVGLTNRGLIKPGYYSDLVLFDPTIIADQSTFELPHRQAIGVQTVWVNGVVVFQGSSPTGVRSGRPLRRGAT